MKIIFAQGNPEDRYQATRHNVGFQVIDIFASSHNCTFTAKPKFFADIAECTVAGEKVLLVKPTTYYNETGRCFRAILDFYKLAPEDVLIVHDELALPLGTLRTRMGGSDAGNNGIKSINQHGGQTTSRLRVGIANNRGLTITDVDFVLGRFNAAESDILTQLIIPAAIEFIESFISGDFAPHSITVLEEPAVDQER